MSDAMAPFQGWRLPPGFPLGETEVGEVRDPGGSTIRYPDLAPGRLEALLQTLRESRESSLVSLPVSRVVDAVDAVAARFRDADDPLRDEALKRLASLAGYSPEMAQKVLDGMAEGWKGKALWKLLHSEFRDPGVLDGFRPGAAGGHSRALGHPLTFHLGAGTVPGVSVTSLIRGLLVKSAALVKPGLGDLPLPVLFAGALAEEAPELAGSVAVLYWPTGDGAFTKTVVRGADMVVAYGGDETIREIRRDLPPHTPFRAYRHRIGFALVGREALGTGGPSAGAGSSPLAAARAAAGAVALFDQRGCVSPHAILVERGGAVDPGAWAELLGEALSEMEASLPSGRILPEEAAEIQQTRGAAELEEGLGSGMVRHGGKRAPWTVLYLPRGPIRPSCLHRTVRVLPVETLQDALLRLEEWAPYLQTVGVVGLGERESEVLEGLARLGVSRISSLERVPWPGTWWHHDGSAPLQDLVRWTDREED